MKRVRVLVEKLSTDMFLLLILFVGGLGVNSFWFDLIILIVVSVHLLFILLRNKKFIMPQSFFTHLGYLFFMAFSIFWSKDILSTINFLLKFLVGLVLWLSFYNIMLKNQTSRLFVRKFDYSLWINRIFIVFTVYCIFYFYNEYFGEKFVSAYGFVGYTGEYFNHHHIGDLAGVVLLSLFGNSLLQLSLNSKNTDSKNFLLIPILKPRTFSVWMKICLSRISGTSYKASIDKIPRVQTRGSLLTYIEVALLLFVILLSGSRSAVFGLIIASIYLYFLVFKFNNSTFFRRIVIGFLVVLVAFILTISSFKSIFTSRIYFIQSIVGLLDFPHGVGFGNFYYISSFVSERYSQLSNVSYTVHNLLLEFVSGFGYLAVFPIILFFKSTYSVFKVLPLISDYKKKIKDLRLVREIICLASILVFLLVNFMTDYTYFVSTVLWIYYISLSIIDARLSLIEKK